MRALLKRQPVLPAPICGVSDYVFRDLCRRMGAEATYTQMISATALSRGDAKTRERIDLEPGEPKVIVQLFGCEPEHLARSCALVERLGAWGVDLNMGCPARKVIAQGSGAALMRSRERVARIVGAMRGALSIPLSVKMRWDWDGRSEAALELGRIARDEGADAVTLHARLYRQGYAGTANWPWIERLASALDIPVIGNGDVRRPEQARQMLERTDCAGVMIGRALIGNPWLLRNALSAVRGGEGEPSGCSGPSWAERRAVLLEHAAAMERRYGRRGLVRFRKQAVEYIRGVAGARHLRPLLMRAERVDQFRVVLDHSSWSAGGPLRRSEAADPDRLVTEGPIGPAR